MQTVSLTGTDTIQINDRILADLADADAVTLNFANDLASVKTGKNGNTIYAKNEMGRMVDCVIRVLLGSSDDKYLNSQMQDMNNSFSDFSLLTGSFSKRVGDGTGENPSTVVYQLSGGIFKKQVDTKTSAEGDTEQSVAVYNITFGNSSKSIQ